MPPPHPTPSSFPLIKCNQVLPLGVRPEPKSTSPGQASLQICVSRSKLHFGDSLTSGHSRPRTDPPERVCQLMSRVSHWVTVLFPSLWSVCTAVVVFEENRASTGWILTCSLMSRKEGTRERLCCLKAETLCCCLMVPYIWAAAAQSQIRCDAVHCVSSLLHHIISYHIVA